MSSIFSDQQAMENQTPITFSILAGNPACKISQQIRLIALSNKTIDMEVLLG
jgi:hypothetical protein